jgi:hypothetical protein
VTTVDRHGRFENEIRDVGRERRICIMVPNPQKTLGRMFRASSYRLTNTQQISLAVSEPHGPFAHAATTRVVAGNFRKCR